jgi:hypothetical protein
MFQTGGFLILWFISNSLELQYIGFGSLQFSPKDDTLPFRLPTCLVANCVLKYCSIFYTGVC